MGEGAGGQPEDAALKLVACVKVGWPWLRFKEFTERLGDFWFSRGAAEELFKRWKRFKASNK